MDAFPLLVFIVIVLLITIAAGLRVVKEYERGVVFRLGKLRPQVKQPGLRVIIPYVDQMRKVNLRVITMPVQAQRIITNDNVSIDVSAVAYYHIVDPVRAVIEVENIVSAIREIAQTTVRNVVGQFELDAVLGDTEAINGKIKDILDAVTEQWGAVVNIVELKDIELPESMQRAMARQAEAEREKRAKIIAAEGEALSAQKLGEAADVITQHPVALQLRNLQVLMEIAAEKNSTIIFPNQFSTTMQELSHFMSREMNATK